MYYDADGNLIEDVEMPYLAPDLFSQAMPIMADPMTEPYLTSAPTPVEDDLVTVDDLSQLYASNPYSVIAEDQLRNLQTEAETFRDDSLRRAGMARDERQRMLLGEAGIFRDDAVSRAYQRQEQELARIKDFEAQRYAAVAAQVAAELQQTGQWETTSYGELDKEVNRRLAAEDAAKQERLTGVEGYLGAYRQNLDYGLQKDQERFASLLGATGRVGQAARMTYDARNQAENAIAMERGAKTLPIIDQWLAGKEDAQRFGYGGRGDIRNEADRRRTSISRFGYNENQTVARDAYGMRKGAYDAASAAISDAQSAYGNARTGVLNDTTNTFNNVVDAAQRDYASRRAGNVENFYAGRRTGVADQDRKIDNQVQQYLTSSNNALQANDAGLQSAQQTAVSKGDIAANSAVAQGNARAAGAYGVADAIGDWYGRRRRTSGGGSASGGYLDPVDDWGRGGTNFRF